MKIKIKYELPVFSASLEENPIFKPKGLNLDIDLLGYDEENRLRKIVIRFKSVICSKHTSKSFTPKLYDAYDRIVELVDSEWLKELKNFREEEFNYWKLKHYVIFLHGEGMFQFIAQGYEVLENE